MAGKSLVSRLIWLLTSSMAALWLLGSVAAGMLTVFEVNERLDNAIEEVAQRLLPATYGTVQQPKAMQQMARQLVATLDPKALAYQIIGPAGEVAMRSENAPDSPFPVPRQGGFHDTRQYRIYSQPAAADGYFIEVAEPAMHRSEALGRAIALTVGPLVLFLPLSWFLIRWAVFRGMRSLDQLRGEIGRRDGSNLSQIPDMGLPSELAPILSAVNRLLERLERALATERQFAANSAHELRTPIAAVLAQMQLLSAYRQPDKGTEQPCREAIATLTRRRRGRDAKAANRHTDGPASTGRRISPSRGRGRPAGRYRAVFRRADRTGGIGCCRHHAP
jgi:two-component system, OmpR family, sensor kinase